MRGVVGGFKGLKVLKALGGLGLYGIRVFESLHIYTFRDLGFLSFEAAGF